MAFSFRRSICASSSSILRLASSSAAVLSEWPHAGQLLGCMWPSCAPGLVGSEGAGGDTARAAAMALGGSTRAVLFGGPAWRGEGGNKYVYRERGRGWSRRVLGFSVVTRPLSR